MKLIIDCYCFYMHKETLKTAYSSNPEENLLSFADQGDLSDSSSRPKEAREDIKGWVDDSKMDSSDQIKLHSAVSERRPSVPRQRRFLHSRTSNQNEQNRDALKLKLNEYLDHSDNEPSIEFEMTSMEEKFENAFLSFNSIIIDPKESYREQNSKNATKFNVNTSRNHSHSVSMKFRTSSLQKNQQKTVLNNSFRLKTHKKVASDLFSHPLVASFPSDHEENKLKEKLNSYLRTHVRIRNL